MPRSSAAGPAGRAAAWLGGAAFVASMMFCGYSYVGPFGRATAVEGPVAWPVAINVVLFSLFAVHHSVMARTGAKRWIATHVPAALERTVYVWVGSILLAVTCWWWQPVPGVVYALQGSVRPTGWILQLIGVWLTLRSAGVIDIWELSGIRQAMGTQRPPRFRVIGPYHLVRHPIYLGWVLMTFGAPDMTTTRLAFAVVSSAYLAIAVPFEERSLVEAFGDEYVAYTRKVRWRMIPGLY
jgi:protein-S-isoprenylcysteine O-methyltransferase Ste14